MMAGTSTVIELRYQNNEDLFTRTDILSAVPVSSLPSAYTRLCIPIFVAPPSKQLIHILARLRTGQINSKKPLGEGSIACKSRTLPHEAVFIVSASSSNFHPLHVVDQVEHWPPTLPLSPQVRPYLSYSTRRFPHYRPTSILYAPASKAASFPFALPKASVED